VRTEVRDPIVEITLARPPVNAFDRAMYRELRDVFAGIPDLVPTARVVILAADGRHFCAGNDLNEFRTLNRDNAASRMREVREAFWAIYDCPIPVIGAVQGAALGTGLAIAASCDFVVAAANARFGLPELSVGVMGGARHLARLVPQPVVRSMFYSSDPIEVERLVRLGAVIDVVPTAELLTFARARAARLARHDLLLLRTAKRALNAIETMELKPGYEFEQGLTCELSGRPEAKLALQSALAETRSLGGRKS